jgi:3-keto-disaccharide hydrolase
MKSLVLLATALALSAQQGAPPAQKKSGGNQIPASAGDDVRGYNDTPQLPDQKWKVHDMTRPRARKVTPGQPFMETPPSDAIVLFDGKDLSHWVQMGRGGQAQDPKWKVENGYMEIVPRTGKLQTKEKFGDCQLHVEWMIPKGVSGQGQGRGNSGVELMTRYEVQVLESHTNLTYADGAAGAMYGAWPPLVNPARPEGEWNVYDIVFEAPRFEDGKLVKPAYFTVLFNGVLVHNHQAQLGQTIWRQVARYTPHGPEEPLSLQDHSQPVRYRNIWIRRLTKYDEQ